MHKRALTLILPAFMAVSFGFVASGCDDKADKKDEKKADEKKDEKKEEKADGGW
jgi:ribosomal protein L12E/L44/L45/RPP1/RPP2